mmetsp:Transcript_102011/g.140941  ORF Transcript_102011/g.140941 Transcript_102011/m.140941 type:complete len:96 (+) Transcript_102011:3-290(+)
MGHGSIPICLTCLKRFGSKQAINQHQDSTGHMGIEWLNESDEDPTSESGSEVEVSYNCVCGRCFFSQHSITQHMMATGHTGYTACSPEAARLLFG